MRLSPQEVKRRKTARKAHALANASITALALGTAYAVLNRHDRMKKAKKIGLRWWSLTVRARDLKCIMCGKTETLQAHHWLFRKSHSVRLSLDPANGATLCYGCHIGRVHHDGDGDFILQLAEKMTFIVGDHKVAEMKAVGRNPTDMSLEEVEEAVKKLMPTTL